ncbi:hypothetical protein ACIBCT_21025 [Streptosporangium sp. NPDC050855]|uniref:hypothetical protein n=1 Tax=Streptosporangium sp. NPDC050855 TaxID=3366194 RepID=UPI00378B3D60
MKVYLAASDEPGEYNYENLRIFTRREDAEAYELAAHIAEFELTEGPVEVQTWHTIRWHLGEHQEPQERTERRDFDGNTSTFRSTWEGPALRPTAIVVGAWDLQAARDAFADERAQYMAMRDGLAAKYTAGLDRIEVQVWYEVGGRAVLKTPVHTTADHFTVPRERITEQAGLAPDATLHGQWFTVETLTFTDAQGFAVCAPPVAPKLAG